MKSLYAERALRAGASGYIMKQEATVSERMASRMLHRLVGGLIGEGLSTRLIAEELHNSVKTVESYQVQRRFSILPTDRA